MHEFSLVQSLLTIVQDKVKENRGGKVTKILVKVGTLSGAEPELLESAFQFLKDGTCAEEAILTVIKEKAQVKCRKCGTIYFPKDLDLTCPNCGNWGGEVLSGESIYLERLEMEILSQPKSSGEI